MGSGERRSGAGRRLPLVSPGRERGGAVGRAGAGLAVMADDRDGRLRTEGSSDGSGPAGGGAGDPPAGAAAMGGEMLLNVGLLALALLAAYRLYLRWGTRSGPGGAARQNQAAALPRMKRRDFSLEQLREFDGTRNPRILLAVNGKVFDVTKGSKFYGPGETPARRGLGGPSAAASLPPTLPPCRARAPRLLRAARRVSGGEGEAAPGRTAGMCRGGRALPRRPGLCAGGARAAPPPRGRWVSERPRGVPPLVAPLGLWVCLGRATPRFPAARDASRGRQLPAGCQGSPACEPRPVAAARGPAERPPGTVLQFQTGDAKRVSGLFGLPSHIQFSGCLDLDVQRLIVFFPYLF